MIHKCSMQVSMSNTMSRNPILNQSKTAEQIKWDIR